MKRMPLFILLLFAAITGFSQTISFADVELKNYLIHENCIDTNRTDNNGWWNGDIDADVNDDGEIDQQEAERVLNLGIQDFSDAYRIKSVQDLSQFRNLNWLQIIGIDSLYEISNLELDSLRSLWIGTNYSLRRVDISDLWNLTEDFRVEDIDTLDYLNIQNGNRARYFSLFYTQYIREACVDSIAIEYNEVAWRLLSGVPKMEDCYEAASIHPVIPNHQVGLFPNPTTGSFRINTSSKILKIKILNPQGIVIKEWQPLADEMDISSVASGLYHLIFTMEEGVAFGKIWKM